MPYVAAERMWRWHLTYEEKAYHWLQKKTAIDISKQLWKPNNECEQSMALGDVSEMVTEMTFASDIADDCVQ